MTGPSDAELAAAAAAVFSDLLAATHLSRPSDLAAELAAKARPLGIGDLVVYLVDYEQTALVPLTGAGVPERTVLRIDGTLAGRAYSAGSIHRSDAGHPDRSRLWVPLIDGTERLGVLEVTVPAPGGEVPAALLTYCERYAHLAAGQLVAKSWYGDTYELARRRRPMTVGAELQWTLLPPRLRHPRAGGGRRGGALLRRRRGQLRLRGGGSGRAPGRARRDGPRAHRRLHLRGRGVGVPGGPPAGAGPAGDVRGGGRDDAGRVRPGSASPPRCWPGSTWTPAGLAWVNAGHPAPLLLRGGKAVRPLRARPATPLGMPVDTGPVTVGTEGLQPGDRVLFYTDGVTEARTADGDFFTAERLAEFLERQAAAGLPTPETLRRLRLAILAHQDGRLQDDATVLLVEWRRDAELALLPETVEP